MRKRTPAAPAILVESGDEHAWNETGRRLRELDPERYRRTLALAQSFVSAHISEESALIVEARCMSMRPTRGEA